MKRVEEKSSLASTMRRCFTGLQAYRPFVVLLASLAILLHFSGVARADPLDDEARRIGKMLQCPVCEGVSVADSPSQIALQMMSVIRDKLEAGESEDQILQYFVQRYGEGVLREPPRRGAALLVWWGPVLVLAAGALVLFTLLRTWRSATSRVGPGPGLPAHGSSAQTDRRMGGGQAGLLPGARTSDPYVGLVERELESFRREVGD